MDFKTQTNQQPQRSGAPANGTSQGDNGHGSGRRKAIPLVASLLIVIALLAGAFALWQGKSESSVSAEGVEADKYQAVFMTNGQVYFGKLAKLDGDYTELTDVYYLQVQGAVQEAAKTTTPAEEQSQVSLTKLGNELHGPTDKMHISRDQVLFWENLKNDSTVVKAITDYKAKQ